MYRSDCGMSIRALSDNLRNSTVNYNVCSKKESKIAVHDSVNCEFNDMKGSFSISCNSQVICSGNDCFDKCISYGVSKLVCFKTDKEAREVFKPAPESITVCSRLRGLSVGCDEPTRRPQPFIPHDAKNRDARCQNIEV
jgi:hypothetical protein